MPRNWSDKRERQYEHIKSSQLERGEDEDEDTAEEIAARTVNKERARSGETGRTKDQLYEEAKRRNIRGRSKMDKEELEEALSR